MRMIELVRFESFGDEVWVNPANVCALVPAPSNDAEEKWRRTEIRLSGAPSALFVDMPVGAVRERLTRRVV